MFAAETTPHVNKAWRRFHTLPRERRSSRSSGKHRKGSTPRPLSPDGRDSGSDDEGGRRSRARDAASEHILALSRPRSVVRTSSPLLGSLLFDPSMVGLQQLSAEKEKDRSIPLPRIPSSPVRSPGSRKRRKLPPPVETGDEEDAAAVPALPTPPPSASTTSAPASTISRRRRRRRLVADGPTEEELAAAAAKAAADEQALLAARRRCVRQKDLLSKLRHQSAQRGSQRDDLRRELEFMRSIAGDGGKGGYASRAAAGAGAGAGEDGGGSSAARAGMRMTASRRLLSVLEDSSKSSGKGVAKQPSRPAGRSVRGRRRGGRRAGRGASSSAGSSSASSSGSAGGMAASTLPHTAAAAVSSPARLDSLAGVSPALRERHNELRRRLSALDIRMADALSYRPTLQRMRVRLQRTAITPPVVAERETVVKQVATELAQLQTVKDQMTRLSAQAATNLATMRRRMAAYRSTWKERLAEARAEVERGAELRAEYEAKLQAARAAVPKDGGLRSTLQWRQASALLAAARLSALGRTAQQLEKAYLKLRKLTGASSPMDIVRKLNQWQRDRSYLEATVERLQAKSEALSGQLADARSSLLLIKFGEQRRNSAALRRAAAEEGEERMAAAQAAVVASRDRFHAARDMVLRLGACLRTLRERIAHLRHLPPPDSLLAAASSPMPSPRLLHHASPSSRRSSSTSRARASISSSAAATAAAPSASELDAATPLEHLTAVERTLTALFKQVRGYGATALKSSPSRASLRTASPPPAIDGISVHSAASSASPPLSASAALRPSTAPEATAARSSASAGPPRLLVSFAAEETAVGGVGGVGVGGVGVGGSRAMAASIRPASAAPAVPSRMDGALLELSTGLPAERNVRVEQAAEDTSPAAVKLRTLRAAFAPAIVRKSDSCRTESIAAVLERLDVALSDDDLQAQLAKLDRLQSGRVTFATFAAWWDEFEEEGTMTLDRRALKRSAVRMAKEEQRRARRARQRIAAGEGGSMQALTESGRVAAIGGVRVFGE